MNEASIDLGMQHEQGRPPERDLSLDQGSGVSITEVSVRPSQIPSSSHSRQALTGNSSWRALPSVSVAPSWVIEVFLMLC